MRRPVQITLGAAFAVLFGSGAVLASGLSGAVTCVQEQLHALGYAEVTPNGKLDARTKLAAALLRADQSEIQQKLPSIEHSNVLQWCRVLGERDTALEKFWPSRDQSVVLTEGVDGDYRSGILSFGLKSIHQYFQDRHGIRLASHFDVAGAADPAALARFSETLAVKAGAAPNLGPRAVARFCPGNRFGGVTNSDVVLVCWPAAAQYDSRWAGAVRWRLVSVLAHEVMHQVQLELSNSKWPRPSRIGSRSRIGPTWLSEGSAEVIAKDYLAHVDPTYSMKWRKLLRSVSQNTRPLSDMHGLGALDGAMDYETAHLASFILARRCGKHCMIDYWSALGRGETWEVAFRDTFGFDLAEYEAAFENLRRSPQMAASFMRN